MNPWTEQAIRQYLDGSFTRFQHDGTVKTISVPLDYDPITRPPPVERSKHAHKRPRQTWSRAQDRVMLQLRDQGLTRKEIGRHLGRTEEAIAARLYKLTLGA